MSAGRTFWTSKGVIKGWTDVTKMEELFDPRERRRGLRPKWIFRAEKPDQDLKTSLDVKFDLNGTGSADRAKRERELIKKFQRRAGLYLEHEPDKDDILEWLAIMRHYGAPTRVLDWTYSFYVAVYFALNESDKGVIWVLNVGAIYRPEPIVKKICDREDGFRKFSQALLYYLKQSDFLGVRTEGDKLIDLAIASYLIEHPFPCVYPVNPFRLNKRLSVQQGLFLMPGDIKVPFAENLRASFGGFRKTRAYLWKVGITPEKDDRKEILRRLRDMNISNEALFPGLDGLGRSVGEGLAYPDA